METATEIQEHGADKIGENTEASGLQFKTTVMVARGLEVMQNPLGSPKSFSIEDSTEKRLIENVLGEDQSRSVSATDTSTSITESLALEKLQKVGEGFGNSSENMKSSTKTNEKSSTETNELQVAQDETLNSVFEGEPLISKDENFTRLSLQDYAAAERTPIEKEMENEESQNDKLEEDDKEKWEIKTGDSSEKSQNDKLEEDDKEKGEIKTGDSSEIDASDSKERVEDQELPKASELSSEEMLAKTDGLGLEEEKRETGNIGKAHETESKDQEDASNLEPIEKLELEAGSAYIAAEETTTKEDEQESEEPEEDFDLQSNDKGQEANDSSPEREEEEGVKLQSKDSNHPVEGPTETRLDEFSKKSWSQRDEINDNVGEKVIIALQEKNEEAFDVTKTPATEMAKPESNPSDSAPVQVLDESKESGEEVNKEDLDAVGEKEIQTDAPIEEDIENKKLDASSSALGAETTSLHTEEIQNELTSTPLVTLHSGQTDKNEDTCQDCPREHESQRKKIDPSETTNEVVEQGVKIDEVQQENKYEKPITVPDTVPEDCGANIRTETETPTHMIMVDQSDEVGGEMFGALETINEVEYGATIDEAKTDLTDEKASTASKAVPEDQEAETRAETGTFTHKIMVENQSEEEVKAFSGLASQEQEFRKIKDQFPEEGQTRSINLKIHSVIQTTDEPCLQKELWPQNITDHTYEEKLHSDKQDNVPVAQAQCKNKLNEDYSRNEPFTSKREAESCNISLDALSTMKDPVNMNIQKTAAVSEVEMHNLEIMEEHKDPESIVVDEKINEATTCTSLQTDEKLSKVSDLNTNIEKEIFSIDANTRSDIHEKAEDPVDKPKESSEDGIGSKKLEDAAPQWNSEDQSDETYSANENIENDISNEKEEAKGDQKLDEEEVPLVEPENQNHGTNSVHAITSDELLNEEEDGRSIDRSEKTEIVDPKDDSKAGKNIDVLPVTPESIEETMQDGARDKDDEASTCIPKEQIHYTIEENDMKTEESNINLEVEDQNYEVEASDLLSKERSLELPSSPAEEVAVVRLNNEEPNKVADSSAVTSILVAGRTKEQVSEKPQESTKCFSEEDIQETIKLDEENNNEGLERDYESATLQAPVEENMLKEDAITEACEEHNYEVIGTEESKKSTTLEEDQDTKEETSRQNIVTDGFLNQKEDVHSVDPSKNMENVDTKDDDKAGKNINDLHVTPTSVEEIIQAEAWEKAEEASSCVPEEQIPETVEANERIIVNAIKGNAESEAIQIDSIPALANQRNEDPERLDIIVCNLTPSDVSVDESMQRSEASLPKTEECASKTIEVSESKETTNESILEMLESSLETDFTKDEQPEKVYKLDSEDISENMNAKEVITEEGDVKKLLFCDQSKAAGDILNEKDTKLMEEIPEIVPHDIASNKISNEEVSEEIRAFGTAENLEGESNLNNLKPNSIKDDLDEESFRQSNDDSMAEESTTQLEVEDQIYEASEIAETASGQIEEDIITEEAKGDHMYEGAVPLVEPKKQNYGTNNVHDIAIYAVLSEEEDGRSNDPSEKTEILDAKDESKAGKDFDGLPVTPTSVEEPMQEEAREKDDKASSGVPKEQSHETLEANDKKTEQSNINLEVEDQIYEVGGIAETTASGLTEKVKASDLLPKERNLEIPSPLAEEVPVVRLSNEEPNKVADGSDVTSTSVAERTNKQESEEHQEITKFFLEEDIQGTIKIEEESKTEKLERDSESTIEEHEEISVKEQSRIEISADDRCFDDSGAVVSTLQAPLEENTLKEEAPLAASEEHNYEVRGSEESKESTNWEEDQVTDEETLREKIAVDGPKEDVSSVNPNKKIENVDTKDDDNADKNIDAMHVTRTSIEEIVQGEEWKKDEKSMQRSEASLHEAEEDASKTIKVSESKEGTNELSLETFESSLQTDFPKVEQPEKVYKLDSEDISQNINAREVIKEEDGLKKLTLYVQSEPVGESLNQGDTKLVEETPEIAPQDIASNEISNKEVSEEIKAFGKAENIEEENNLKPDSAKDDLDEKSFRQSNDDNMTEESTIKLEVEDQTYEAKEIAETTTRQIEKEEAKGDHKQEGAVPLLDSEHENYGTNCVHDIATNKVSNEEDDGRSIDGREKTEIVDANDDNKAGENIDALPVTSTLVKETMLEEATAKDGEASSCVRKEQSHETIEANDIKTEESNINLEVEDKNYEASGTAETTGSGLSEKVYFLLNERNFQLPSSSAEEVQVAKVNNEEPNKLADASAVTRTSVADMTKEQVNEKPHETATFFSEEDIQETIKLDEENKTEKLERESESASEEREQIIVKEQNRTEISEDDRCFEDSVAVVSTLQAPVEENVLKEEATPTESEEHSYEVMGIEESKESTTQKEDQATHEEISRQNIAMDGILNQKDVNAADPSKNIENVDTNDEDNASNSIDDLHVTPISVEETIEEEEQIHGPTEDNDRIRFDSLKGNAESESIRRDSKPAQENQRNEPTTEIENAKINFSNDPEGLDFTDCNLTTSPVSIGGIMQKSEASLQEAEEYARKTIEVSESKEGTSMEDKGPRLETLESNLQTEVTKGEQSENEQKLYSEAISEGINAREVIKEKGGVEKLKLYCQNGTVGESFKEEDMKLMEEAPEMVLQDIASNEISNEEVSEEIKASGTAENIEGESNLNNPIKDYLDEQSFQESNDANMAEESTIKLEVEDQTYEASEIAETTSGQIEEDRASDIRKEERNCEQSISPTEEVEVVSLNNEDPNETGDASPFTSTSIAEKTKESISEEHQQTTRFVSKEEIQESLKIKEDNETEKFGRDSEPVSEEHEKASVKEISIIEISKDEGSFKDAVGVVSTLQTPVEDTMQKEKEKEKEAPAKTEDHSYEVIEMRESKETATLEEDQATNKGPSRLSLETNLMEIEQLEKGCKMDSENKKDCDARGKKDEKTGIEDSDVCLHKEITDEEHPEKPSSTMFEGLKPTDVCKNMKKETKNEEDGTERLDTQTIESRSTENKKEDAKLEQATVGQEQSYETSTELEHIKEPPSDQGFEGLKGDEIEENTEEHTIEEEHAIEEDLDVKDLDYTFVENKLVDPSFRVDKNKNQEQPTPEMQAEEQNNEVVRIKGDDGPCKSGDASGVSNLSLEESTEQEVADKHQGIIKFVDEEQTQETIILKEEIQPERLETQSISEELEIIAEKESTNNEISKDDKVSEITVDSSLSFQDSIQENNAEGEKFISDRELGSEKQLEIEIEEKMLNEEEVENAGLLQDQHEHLENPSYQVSKEIKISSQDEDIEKHIIKEGEDARQVAAPDLKPEDEKMSDEVSEEIQVRSQNFENEIIQEEHAAANRPENDSSTYEKVEESFQEYESNKMEDASFGLEIEKQSYKTDEEVSNEPSKVDTVEQAKEEENREEDFNATSIKDEMDDQKILHKEDQEIPEETPQLGVEDQIREASDSNGFTENGKSQEVMPSDIVSKEQCFEITKSTSETIETVSLKDEEEPNKVTDFSLATTKSTEEKAPEEVAEKNQEITKALNEEETQEIINPVAEHESKKIERELEQVVDSLEVTGENDNIANQIKEDEGSAKELEAVSGGEKVEESATIDEIKMLEAAIPEPEPEHQTYQTKFSKDTSENETSNEDDTEASGGVVILEKHVIEEDAAKDLEASYVICEKVEENIQGDVSKELEESPQAFEPKEYQSRDTEKESHGLEGVNDDENSDKKIIEEEFTPNELNSMSSGGDKVEESFQECETGPGLDVVDQHYETIDGSYTAKNGISNDVVSKEIEGTDDEKSEKQVLEEESTSKQQKSVTVESKKDEQNLQGEEATLELEVRDRSNKANDDDGTMNDTLNQVATYLNPVLIEQNVIKTGSDAIESSAERNNKYPVKEVNATDITTVPEEDDKQEEVGHDVEESPDSVPIMKSDEPIITAEKNNHFASEETASSEELTAVQKLMIPPADPVLAHESTNSSDITEKMLPEEGEKKLPDASTTLLEQHCDNEKVNEVEAEKENPGLASIFEVLHKEDKKLAEVSSLMASEKIQESISNSKDEGTSDFLSIKQETEEYKTQEEEQDGPKKPENMSAALVVDKEKQVKTNAPENAEVSTVKVEEGTLKNVNSSSVKEASIEGKKIQEASDLDPEVEFDKRSDTNRDFQINTQNPDDKTKTNSAVADQIRQSLEVGSNFEAEKSEVESHDNLIEKRIEDASDDQNEKGFEAYSNKIRLSDLLEKSTRKTEVMTDNVVEEGNSDVKKGELENELAVEVHLEEEKTDEEEEEHKNDGESDTPVIVEASRDTDVKPSPKKSHNILSGVGSKVKHSIAKVKKAITGKSSHAKTTSPK